MNCVQFCYLRICRTYFKEYEHCFMALMTCQWCHHANVSSVDHSLAMAEISSVFIIQIQMQFTAKSNQFFLLSIPTVLKQPCLVEVNMAGWPKESVRFYFIAVANIPEHCFCYSATEAELIVLAVVWWWWVMTACQCHICYPCCSGKAAAVIDMCTKHLEAKIHGCNCRNM